MPERQEVRHIGSPAGYAMAALLVGLAVMSVLLSAAMPVWRQAARRDAEAELVFRGEQYARSVVLFQRKFAGAFPPSLELLLEQRFLRKAYADPMVEDGEFQLLYQQTAAVAPGGAAGPGGTGTLGASPFARATPQSPQSGGASETIAGPRGGIIGVASRSEEESIRLYNGRSKYNEWQFVYAEATQQPGAPGGASPGQPVGPGGPGPGGPGGFGPAGPGGTPSGPGSFGPARPGGGAGPSPFGRPGGSGPIPR